MTQEELHFATTIAKAEMAIELFWTYLYDTEMSYHHEDGEQGYMGGVVRMVLDQMDGLLNDMVEHDEVIDDHPEELPHEIAGVDFGDALNALDNLGKECEKWRNEQAKD